MVTALTAPFAAGRGVQEPFSPSSPAAGAGLTFVCDGRGLRRLNTLVFTLVTSAVAGNRFVTVEFTGGDGNAYAVSAVAALQPASQTQRYVGSVNNPSQAWNTGTDAFFPLADCFLYPGDSLKILVTTADAGDQLSKIRGTMERFPLDWEDLPARID